MSTEPSVNVSPESAPTPESAPGSMPPAPDPCEWLLHPGQTCEEYFAERLAELRQEHDEDRAESLRTYYEDLAEAEREAAEAAERAKRRAARKRAYEKRVSWRWRRRPITSA